MKIWNTPRQLLDPSSAVTVLLLGAGGTGSQVAWKLGRMHKAMVALGHPGLMLFIVDFDRFEATNEGRCMVPYTDLGRNKAVSLTSQLNRYFGWNTRGHYQPLRKFKGNIIITAVDTLEARLAVAHHMDHEPGHLQHHEYTHLWLDLGNGPNYAQAVLGGSGLQHAGDILGLGSMMEVPEEPSCSTEEALTRQDLLINDWVATAGTQLLWQAFRKGYLDNNVLYINSAEGQMRPGGLHLDPEPELLSR